MSPQSQGPVSILRPSYLRMVISMLKIRRPLGRLIFNMGIAIPGKTVFLIETAPRWRQYIRKRLCILRHKVQLSSWRWCYFEASTTLRHNETVQVNTGEGGGGVGGCSKTLTSSKIKKMLQIQLGMKCTSFHAWVRYFVWNFKGYL